VEDGNIQTLLLENITIEQLKNHNEEGREISTIQEALND